MSEKHYQIVNSENGIRTYDMKIGIRTYDMEIGVQTNFMTKIGCLSHEVIMLKNKRV